MPKLAGAQRVAGHAGGLVDDDHRGVFVQHGKRQLGLRHRRRASSDRAAALAKPRSAGGEQRAFFTDATIEEHLALGNQAHGGTARQAGALGNKLIQAAALFPPARQQRTGRITHVTPVAKARRGSSPRQEGAPDPAGTRNRALTPTIERSIPEP